MRYYIVKISNLTTLRPCQAGASSFRKTECRKQKTEFVKIRFFLNLTFYSLTRRGILRFANAPLRMTALH